jgi:hypothetical protein
MNKNCLEAVLLLSCSIINLLGPDVIAIAIDRPTDQWPQIVIMIISRAVKAAG